MASGRGAPANRRAPQEGANGPLTPERSRAVLQRLQSGGQPTDIFSLHLALEDAIVGSPLVTGNAVRLLQDGPATYRAMLAAIVGARDHINMETYILDDDAIGRQFAQALLAKQAQGVQVSLLYDSAGTFSAPKAFFQRLRDAAVQGLEFNPVNPLTVRDDWQWNQRDHRKLLIVDGHTVFLGGINISSVYSGGLLRQAAAFRHCQRRDQRAHHQCVLRARSAVAGRLGSRRRARGGGHAHPAFQHRFLAGAAGRAQPLRAAAACRREVFECRGVVLHSKTALVDGVWATVGSTNLDWRSFLHNHELNAVMLGPEFGQQVQAMFERDLAPSDAIELAAWERRGPGVRVQEWFGRLWEYWL